MQESKKKYGSTAVPIGGGKHDNKPSPANQEYIQNDIQDNTEQIFFDFENKLLNYEIFNISKIIYYGINKLVCFFKSHVLTNHFLGFFLM